MTDPDTISADYTLRPSELAATLALLVEARQPVMVWGPLRRSAKSADRPAGRRRRRPAVCRRPGAPARPRRPPRHPVARQRRPHPLGAARLPAAHGRSRPLAHQPGGAAVGGADGASGAVSVGPRPQGRRIRTPRGRLADRLRQPRVRPRRRAPHADAAGIALRPSGDQGRRPGLVRLGGGERNLAGGAVLRAAQARPAASVRSAVAGSGVRVPPHMGDSSPASCNTAGTSIQSPNGPSSGAPWARPPRSSFPPS